jgi:hypothetical protein
MDFTNSSATTRPEEIIGIDGKKKTLRMSSARCNDALIEK